MNLDITGSPSTKDVDQSTRTIAQSDFRSILSLRSVIDSKSAAFGISWNSAKWQRALKRAQYQDSASEIASVPGTERGQPEIFIKAANEFDTPKVTKIDKAAPRVSLQPLQEWEGYVTSISKDSFAARVLDITAAETIEKEAAEFPVSDITRDDLQYLELGAVFRWIIGYSRSASGGKVRVSKLFFRRRIGHSTFDLKQASLLAEKRAQELIWE